MGYIEFAKPVNEAEAVKRIETRIKQNNELNSLYKRIIPVLESWNGKKAGKRLQAALIEALDGVNNFSQNNDAWGVSVDKNYFGTMYIAFTKPLFKDWCLSYNLCDAKKDSTFDFADFTKREEHIFSFSAEKENEKLFKLIDRIPVMVQNWNDALKTMQFINEQAENSPVSYSPFFDINGR